MAIGNVVLKNNVKTALEIDGFLKRLILNQFEHEQKIQKEIKKINGVFFTNEVAILNCINNIVEIDSELLNKKMLEPACGYGVFILHLIALIYKKFPYKEVINSFIEDSLIFVDIDQEMVEKTKENINKLYFFLFDIAYTGRFNSFVFDFTEKLKPAVEGLFLNSHKNILFSYINNIDYIIGNPPYVSLYGRRDKKQNEHQRVKYLETYEQFPASVKNGKINLVMLFIEHAIDFLKIGGVFSFIIDVAFFETAYKYTRKFLLEKTSIISIDHNISGFEGVASGQIIIKAKKGDVSQDHNVIVSDLKTKTVNAVRQSNWDNQDDEYKFRINNNCISDKIIKKIHQKSKKTLKQLYPNKNLRTCVMLLDMEDKFIFSSNNLRDNVSVYPYYQGSKGLRYKYADMTNDKYFYYDKILQNKINDELKSKLTLLGIKNKKRLGLGDTEVYSNPKVFIRQSAKEIIASYDAKASSANNSLYVFSLRNNTLVTTRILKFICGLLNSNLLTFYAQVRRIIRFSIGKQPQIKISDLYTIHVPEDIAIQTEISKYVDKIYLNDDPACSICKINQLLYDYYEITKSEVDFIEKSIRSF